jgi:hypothetical protein
VIKNSFLNFNTFTKIIKRNKTIIKNTTKVLLFKYDNSGENNCRSLVIYGSNLGSTLGIGRFSKSLKNLIYLYLSPNSYSILVGKLLSDGTLEKSSLNSNTRFRFKQSIDRSYYVIESFIHLSHYCSNIPYLTKSKRKGKTHYGLEFSTRNLPCLNELYILFYKDKVKVIPDNIYDLLTPISLAH